MTTVQGLLPTEPGDQPGESAYDVGFRHGDAGHEFHHDPIPKKQRRAYARGYIRGATSRTLRLKREEAP